MLANAVSSAVERLYAAAPAAAERNTVSRVSAVSATARLKPVGEDETDRNAALREDREHVQQRQALTRGVLAVFESTPPADSVGSASDTNSATDNGNPRGQVEVTMPDPQLEAAILRFIHTMFRTLADADIEPDPAAPADTQLLVTGTDKAGPAGDTREALSARIENLARRVAQTAEEPKGLAATDDAKSDAPSPPGDAGETPADPARLPASFGDATQPTGPALQDASLQQAYAEVVQALRANQGDSSGQSQTTRAELVSMMQRLALAMHGAPPIDPGLPTRGGLLSARA